VLVVFVVLVVDEVVLVDEVVDDVVEVLDVDEVDDVVDVDVVLVVVVVVDSTHWLFTQSLPGSHVPHWIGTPQELSVSPHWAPTSGHDLGVQQTPNLSVG